MQVVRRVFAAMGAMAALFAAGAAAAQAPPAPTGPGRLMGTDCNAPPALHCPDTECLGVTVINQGPTVEPKTRRTFFLDCPANYRPGEDVILVLSLHGGGSYANWNRNYFPIMDQKDKYRLVIASPSSPYRAWDAGDDAYLQNIVDQMTASVGKEHVKAFWLAGHSWGGATSARIICTPYFKDKVDVRISLSGGRAGSPARPPAPGAPPPNPAMAAMNATPACDFSFIFTQGENEAKAQGGLPDTSTWAEKYGCGPRAAPREVADVKQGYVWDSTRQNPGSDQWGRYPKPGKAQVMAYPGCKGAMVVADVLRLSKGHTEGLEPKVTEEIVKLAASAPSGKIKAGSWSPPPIPEPPASPLAGPRPRGSGPPT